MSNRNIANFQLYCLDGEWSKEATDDFDQLTHCAQWVSVMARVVKYDGDIPCLEMIDTTGQTVRNYEHVCDVCIYQG